ncbi:MAG: dehypoxanthine futalosine cyclase [Nitrospirae bacterium]|nr:dehypoxanthine futalosine cyclase [Nitrospirota bacterium]
MPARMADNIRKRLHPGDTVTFVIDRNINYTNVCINRCKFCAFWRDEKDKEAYLLDKKTLFNKIKATLALGGTQILIQGGLHPELDINYYVELLRAIKEKFKIHIHGFSPPEICYIADKAGFTLKKTIKILKDAGLDSIPGGGAEILSDRIRKKLSPKKIGKDRWLNVMQEAHNLGMKTTATMMFGSIEKHEDIIEHLDAIRRLQDKTGGFTAFIPWSFQPGNTEISSQFTVHGSRFYPSTAVEYLRVLVLSRIYLDNVPNIQASWVTQGIKLAQVALRFGANDFGSTMIEENVVAAAGVKFKASVKNITDAIKSAGFKPVQRDMYYNELGSGK